MPGILQFPSICFQCPQSLLCSPIMRFKNKLKIGRYLEGHVFDPPPLLSTNQIVKLRATKGKGTPMVTSWQVPGLGLENRCHLLSTLSPTVSNPLTQAHEPSGREVANGVLLCGTRHRKCPSLCNHHKVARVPPSLF